MISPTLADLLVQTAAESVLDTLDRLQRATAPELAPHTQLAASDAQAILDYLLAAGLVAMSGEPTQYVAVPNGARYRRARFQSMRASVLAGVA